MVSHCGTLLVIEFLASIDPVSLPVVAAFVFSLTLYPLGLMLGSSCSPCCDTPCGECETGKLPDTVTVTFDGYPDNGPPFNALAVSFDACFGSGATATASAPAAPNAAGAITGITVTNGGSGYAKLARVEPTVTADGTGGTGADITATITEDTDECGIPYWRVSELVVVDGGQDYTDNGEVVFTVAAGDTEQTSAFALVQTSRDEPELTIVPPEDSGTGATFLVTLEDVGDLPDFWGISAITVTNGGTGYTDGQIPTVGLGDGDVEHAAASLTIRTVRDEPQLTLSGPADLTVNVVSLGGSPETWEIDSITVNDGGSGYSDEQFLTVILGGDDVQVQFASLRIKTVRDEPTLFAQAQFSSSGTGAVLTVNLTQSGDVWVVSSITVVDGGTGYTQGEYFSILPSVGQTVMFAEVTANVTNGVIDSLNIIDGGQYFLDTGVIDEVEVLSPGIFWRDTGVIGAIEILYGGLYYKNLGDIESISLVNGGVYYREEATGTPYVADVTLTLNQIFPSDGAGATFTVTVDDDPDSPTFGEITGVTVDDGGDGYLSQGLPSSYCMADHMNGRPIVLARRKFFGSEFDNQFYACDYYGKICDPLTTGTSEGLPALGAWAFGEVQFSYRTSKTSPSFPFTSVGGPHVGLTTEETIGDCSSFTLHFDASSQSRPAFNNVTATVTSGGGSVEEALTQPPSGSCGSCCLNEDDVPSEVTISMTNLILDPVTSTIPDGDYVAFRSQSFESLYPGIASPAATIWRANADPESGLPSGALVVIIEPCATLAQESPPIEDYAWFRNECDDTCFKKCRMRIVLFNTLSVDSSYSPGCTCTDFPICSPPAGTYTLSGGFAQNYFDATIV